MKKMKVVILRDFSKQPSFTLFVAEKRDDMFLIESLEQHPKYDLPYYMAWHHKEDLIFPGEG